jgi:hypothetical protein
MLVVIFLPGGIMEGVRRVMHIFSRKKAAPAADAQRAEPAEQG